MQGKEFRNVLLFMFNQWNKEYASIIFNGESYNNEKWIFSLGQHIWNKWEEYIEFGQYGAITKLFLELDNDCLTKLIQFVNDFYNKK